MQNEKCEVRTKTTKER